MLKLALRSLWNRRGTALLTIFTIAVSVSLLLGVQQMRTAARAGFASTVTGVDLIVGARSSPLNLLLYSVFRMGDATTDVSWATYQRIARHRDVAWTIPISLGDSHRGFRVIGTSAAYFEHYRFAADNALEFHAGVPFDDLYDAVIGAEVAASLGYQIGETIVLGHGAGAASFANHDDKPFRIVGILQRTGTPVDLTLHVSLEALSAIHLDWQTGAQAPEGARVSAAASRLQNLPPDGVTAFLVGMRSRDMTFTMQRAINEFRPEPLQAVMPGVVLTQLWDLVGIADRALMVVAAFVVLAGLLGMLSAILVSLNERRREMAILRSVGARPRHIVALLVIEAGGMALVGVLAGVALAYLLLVIGREMLAERLGLFIRIAAPGAVELMILGGIIMAALLMALLPAWRAYRNALSDGLVPRV